MDNNFDINNYVEPKKDKLPEGTYHLEFFGTKHLNEEIKELKKVNMDLRLEIIKLKNQVKNKLRI